MHTPEGHVHEHERRDIPVKAIGQFLLGLVISGIVVVAVLAGLWRIFIAMQEQPVVSPWTGPRALPPTPRLQTSPHDDLQAYMERQVKELGSYGWMDQSAGVVRIPIDRAMDLLLERGVPARQQPAAQANRSTANASPAR